MSYTDILLEPHGSVLLIRLNRPKALNALCVNLMQELQSAVQEADVDPEIGCIVITGSEKAFAAGADIKEMQDKTFQDVYREDFITREWEAAAKARTPMIAAVRGYALGGGCELAMMCDILYASETAKFGQPEITIGTIPGAGGTQRLPRFIGKAKAMELVLTGRMMDAEEAERAGLVARIIPDAEIEEEVLKVAKKIAGFSTPAVTTAKESVNRAYESALNEGMMVERRLFHSTFALEDQKEGMAAFAEKRKPVWKNR